MITSRTPLRMSFVGGGTDFPDYYNIYGGEVVSTTIDSYIRVTVDDSPDGRIYLDYFYDNEVVNFVDEIEHDILRECLRYNRLDDIESGIRISVITDIPILGSGLGSSSCLTVGVLNALCNYNGKGCGTKREIADQACTIELDTLNRPIGKQDQYGTAIGGFKHIVFTSNGVLVENIEISENRLIELKNNLLVFYTGVQRNAADILKEQVNNTDDNLRVLHKFKRMTSEFIKVVTSDVSLDYIGLILDEYWRGKKLLAGKISNPFFDNIYDNVMDAGAIGGKLMGAGGGGFFMFYVKPESQYAVRRIMSNFREFNFNFDTTGTVIGEKYV